MTLHTLMWSRISDGVVSLMPSSVASSAAPLSFPCREDTLAETWNALRCGHPVLRHVCSALGRGIGEEKKYEESTGRCQKRATVAVLLVCDAVHLLWPSDKPDLPESRAFEPLFVIPNLSWSRCLASAETFSSSPQKVCVSLAWTLPPGHSCRPPCQCRVHYSVV
jgi:hypothetical protein